MSGRAPAKLPAMFVESGRLARILGTSIPEGVRGVEGVTHDSRRVREGYAFVAVPGFKQDGLRFVPEALRRGAALVVAERPVEGAPVAVVPDAREALAALACAVCGDPSRGLEVYGITGTNGKTTTSYMLYEILAARFGEDTCGLMGTAGTLVGGEEAYSGRTTPEAPEVQGMLAEMVRRGIRRVVMEVSSHGIALKRVWGTRFSGAIFTNLSRDHLDLHGTMEEYYRTKRKLFFWAEGPRVVGVSDGWGRRLASEIEGSKTFGVDPDADYRVGEVREEGGGSSFVLRGPRGWGGSGSRSPAATTCSTRPGPRLLRSRSGSGSRRWRGRSKGCARFRAGSSGCRILSGSRSSWTTRTPRWGWRSCSGRCAR